MGLTLMRQHRAWNGVAFFWRETLAVLPEG